MRWLVGVVVVLACARSAHAGHFKPVPGSVRDRQLAAARDKMIADVRAANPAAVELLQRGLAAEAADDKAAAATAFSAAIELAPNSDHLHRRLCNALVATKHADAGVPECERAVALAADSQWDKVALAAALAVRRQPGDLERAKQLADAAVAADPTDLPTLFTASNVAFERNDPREMTRLSALMLAIDPHGAEAQYFAMLDAAIQANFAAARDHIAEAKVAGLDQADYDASVQMLDAAEAQAAASLQAQRAAGESLPGLDGALWLALAVLGPWLGGMLVLALAGFALSRSTLRAVNTATASGTWDPAGSPRERRLRKVYRAVLAITGVYFYLSVPVLVAVVLAAGGGALYLMWAAGVIFIKIAVIIVVVTGATVIAIVTSFFGARATPTEPGPRIELDDHPQLRALLAEVGDAIDTRAADHVCIVPGTTIAVTEQEGLWGAVAHKHDAPRTLIMGVALFDGMTQLQLKSILAHEHGHFRNADTAGGGFALDVRRVILAMIAKLAHARVLGDFNPAWWFLRSYRRIFLGMSQGASRLQEVLADRWAIQAYGSAAFVAAYRHIVAREVGFEAHAAAVLAEVVRDRRGLANLYAFQPKQPPDDAKLDTAVQKKLVEPPGAFDSHPAPERRIAWAEQLAIAHAAAGDDDAPVWALFADREAIEQQMTTEVRANVRLRRRIVIPAKDPATPAPVSAAERAAAGEPTTSPAE